MLLWACVAGFGVLAWIVVESVVAIRRAPSRQSVIRAELLAAGPGTEEALLARLRAAGRGWWGIERTLGMYLVDLCDAQDVVRDRDGIYYLWPRRWQGPGVPGSPDDAA